MGVDMITKLNAKYIKDVIKFIDTFKLSNVSGNNMRIVKNNNNYDFFYNDLIFHDIDKKSLVEMIKSSKYYGDDIL